MSAQYFSDKLCKNFAQKELHVVRYMFYRQYVHYERTKRYTGNKNSITRNLEINNRKKRSESMSKIYKLTVLKIGDN